MLQDTMRKKKAETDSEAKENNVKELQSPLERFQMACRRNVILSI